jgi:hypothetical protein
MSTANGSEPDKSSPRTQAPPSSSPTRRVLRGLVAVLVLVCIILAGLWVALPRIAQEFFAPVLTKTLNAPDMHIDIRRVDFSGLDLGEISISPDAGLGARAVLIDWSISGLMQGRIDRIRIFGLEVLARKAAAKWDVPGLPAFETSGGAASGPMFLPAIGELQVDGRVSLDSDGLLLSLPFSVRGSLDEEARLLLDATTAPAGQNLNMFLKADLRKNDFQLTCALPSASVAALASLVPGLDRLPLVGALRAVVDLTLPQGQKPQLEAEFGLDAFQGLLGGTPLTQDGNATARLRWQDDPHLTLSPVSLLAPLPLTITISDVTASMEDMAVACSWNLTLPSIPNIQLSLPARLAGRTQVRGTDHGWDMHTEAVLDAIEARPKGTPDVTVSMASATLNLDAAANATGVLVDGQLALDRLRMTRDTAEATLTGLNLAVSATATPDWTGTANVSTARLEARQPGMSLTTTRLEGGCAFSLADQLALNGTVNAAARFAAKDASGFMTLRLPLSWPTPAASPGTVNLDLNWAGKGLAKISSSIAQDLHGARLDGAVSVLPLAFRAAMKGRIDARDIAGSWIELKAGQNVSLPGNLGDFVPAARDLSGSARLDAMARLDMSRGVPLLPVDFKISGLSLSHEKSKLSLNQGSIALSFSDLLNMRSDPDGRMNFDRLQLGTVILEQGDIHFQIEALHSILVEGCRFQWAGGRIGSQAFRINPNVEDYTVELYCDRVQMAQVLEQFGLTQAKGGGTANGRIPLRYANGVLTFDNGFLYSTPGEKGVLKVQGTEILTAGVPPGTPQHGQLDLAAEALKDFSYEWARIRLNTEERELIVSLELDGKPEKPLPFSYNREIGGFARVDASSPGSVFQGIRLDVNFRLPLDQLLQYRQLLELMTNGG